MPNGTVTVLLCALVALASSYVQSVTGFGFGILSMIFLPSLLPYTGANALSSTLSTFTSLFTLILLRRQVNLRNLIFPTVGCLVSTFFAVAFIKQQSNKTLILLLGIMLVLLSLYFFFFSDKIRIKPTPIAGFIAGALSGIGNGMFAIGGPPAVIYFLQSEESSEKYMATISAFFVISGAVSIGSKAVLGFMTPDVLIAIAVGFFTMLGGAFIGKLTRDKIRPHLIKKTIYAFMAMSGVINIVTSLI
jgi:uncharacterized membrane protein YfcA